MKSISLVKIRTPVDLIALSPSSSGLDNTSERKTTLQHVHHGLVHVVTLQATPHYRYCTF